MPKAYRDVLAIRGARALIGASGASQLGGWLYNAALLGYVYNATGSAGRVGAATIGRLLPYVLLGPLGGAVADRYPRRTVLLAGDALRFQLMLALAAVVAADGPVAVVIGFTALASAAGTAERPAAWLCFRAWSAKRGLVRPTRSCTRCRISASVWVRPSARFCSRSPPLGRPSWPTAPRSRSRRC